MLDWRVALLKTIREAGMDNKSVSLKAGLNHGLVSEWLGPKRKAATIENFMAVCNALGRSPASVLGSPALKLHIPVVGIVSGGEGWTALDEHKADPLEFELGDKDVIALEVRGESMEPAYRDGDFLVCQRRAGRNAHNLINSDCVVRTIDGGQFVKILKRGKQPGLFTLKSYNPRFDDMEDVRLEWAARVAWIRRADS